MNTVPIYHGFIDLNRGTYMYNARPAATIHSLNNDTSIIDNARNFLRVPEINHPSRFLHVLKMMYPRHNTAITTHNNGFTVLNRGNKIARTIHAAMRYHLNITTSVALIVRKSHIPLLIKLMKMIKK